ncbi:MAG: hypothetical protein PUP93_28805 [Rhizonema sp. NSF051]|nr:hypothetical protein [Rhizonema sp. NSF051]
MSTESLIKLTNNLKSLYMKIAQKLKGSDRSPIYGRSGIKAWVSQDKQLQNENWGGIDAR